MINQIVELTRQKGRGKKNGEKRVAIKRSPPSHFTSLCPLSSLTLHFFPLSNPKLPQQTTTLTTLTSTSFTQFKLMVASLKDRRQQQPKAISLQQRIQYYRRFCLKRDLKGHSLL